MLRLDAEDVLPLRWSAAPVAAGPAGAPGLLSLVVDLVDNAARAPSAAPQRDEQQAATVLVVLVRPGAAWQRRRAVVFPGRLTSAFATGLADDDHGRRNRPFRRSRGR